MTAPALRALRPAATTSAYAGDRLRARAATPSRVSAISRTRHMAVRVCTVARRAPPRVAASARDPRVSIATATRRAPTAPPRAVRDPGVAVERADDAPESVQPGGSNTETRASSRRVIRTDSIDKAPHASHIAFERGVPFCRGGGDDGGDGVFYRAESAQARDLAVLLARSLNTPRVLDAMAGSGVRSARYLKQGRASHVHVNDASPKAADALLATLDALFSPPASYVNDDDSKEDAFERTNADSVASSADDDDDSYDDDDDEDEDSASSAEDSSSFDPSEAEDFASAVRCLPNPSQKPHPFKKTRRGTKTMSRQEKKALMETKMQKTKLFKLQKVTKKERKMRAEAEAAAAAEAAEPEAAESECDDDDEACPIKEAMARAKEEKKRQRKRQRKKTNGSAVTSSVPTDAEGDSTSSAEESEESEDSRDARDAARDSLGTVAVTSKDARRLFASLFASGAERFDVVDVDSFGSDNFVDDALRVTKLGGYCYATGTDALALCGKNPPRLLSHYGGAFVVPNAPAVNETGLRVFVGDAVRRGAAQGLKVTPAFSLFHPHGPVFRAMLKVEKLAGAWDGESIGFLAQCDACGDARVAESDEIRDGSCFCRRCAKRDAAEKTRMSVSGPLWTGPLHDAAAVAALAREAEEVDFCGGDDEDGVCEERDASSAKGQKASAKALLAAFAAEADPALPPFYRRTDELARAGRGLKHGIPPLDAWIAELQTRGFAACRSHLDARGLKSDAPLEDVVAAANAVAAAKN